MRLGSLPAALLVAPAMALVLLLFVLPLASTLWGAVQGPDGLTLRYFATAFATYARDIVATPLLIGLATVIIGVIAVAIGGYLRLGTSRTAVAILGWLYRWPLFIPFIVAAQCMRGFLGRNGMMNNTLVASGLMDAASAQSFLDWRGVVITFVWKQAPLVTLLVAGAMAAVPERQVHAARGMGAGRLRVLMRVILPQAKDSLMVGLILSFVTMMSVLSVPAMLSSSSPTVITVAMAWRVNALGDYGTANALGAVATVFSGLFAWAFLRRSLAQRSRELA